MMNNKKLTSRYLSWLILIFLVMSMSVHAVTITATSIVDLQNKINAAASGTIINLANGHYTNNTISISKSNITVQATTAGGVYLDGTNTITISGSNNTFSGFQFTLGTITSNVVTVTGNTNTITQLNFNGYSASKMVQLEGQYNVVSFCNFQNKPAPNLVNHGGDGDMVQIIPNATNPGYNIIRYCSFQHMPGFGGDFGNECIRIGDGSYSTYVSRTVVEYCYFEDTGLGDSEAISVKSMENILRYNTMNNNPNAMFCFRNGDYNVAYGNFFIKSGGVRCKQSNHNWIYNNYFEMAGLGWDNTLPGSGTRPIYFLTYAGYNNDYNVFNNTFYKCGEIEIQSGMTNCTWANNAFYSNSGNIFSNSGTTDGQTFVGNLYSGTLGLSISSGMTKNDPKLAINADGFYSLSAGSPAIDATNASFPSILDIANQMDDPNLMLDISGYLRPATTSLKDVGCSEYNSTGTVLNKPLTVSNVGPSYLGGPATPTLTNQAIVFNALSAKTTGDVDFAPSASATSGLSVTYASSNTAVATIISNQIHIVGGGTSTITASQVGNTMYNAASAATQTLTVSKQNQTISFGALATKVVTDADFSAGATASSGLAVSLASSNTAVATIVSGQIHIIGSGTTNITASQVGNAVYNAASDVVQVLTVSLPAKLNQTIMFNALARKSTLDVDFSPGATATSGLDVTYTSSNTSVATIVGGLIHIVGGGMATITASQSGNSSYNSAVDVSQSLSIDVVNSVSITLNPIADSYVFGGGTTTNFGGITDLLVKKGSGTSGDRSIYLQFDISGQNIYSVSSAKVRLYANTAPSAITVTASQTTDSWTETGITYANCPAKGTDISSVLVTAAGAYYEWDVASYIRTQLNSNDNIISLVFSDLTADGVIDKFNSREALSNTPQLYLMLNQIVTSNSNKKADNFKAYFNSNSKLATVDYMLTKDSHVSAQIYTIDGQLIRSLDTNESVGAHQLVFNVSELKSGIYLVRFNSNNNTKTTKLVLNE